MTDTESGPPRWQSWCWLSLLLPALAFGQAFAQSQPINEGMDGAWFDPATSGQGVLLDVDPEAGLLFLAWFTFDASASADDGLDAHRWYTAQGNYAGDTAEMPVSLTRGGVFDAPSGTTTNTVGSVTLQFLSCTEATLSYQFDDSGDAGVIALRRIAPDVLCGEHSQATQQMSVADQSPGVSVVHGGGVVDPLRVETLATDFEASGDVAVGPDGNIYVGNYGSTLNDSIGTTVTQITPDGAANTFASGWNGASGNVFDSNGYLYQSNIRGAQVIRVAPDGTQEVYASGITGGVIGLAFDSQGNLYANSCGENRVYRITPNRNVSVFASGPPLSCPNGLTADDEDNLYAVNFDNGIVSRIDTAGNVSELARTPPGVFRSSGGNGHVTFGNGVIYTVSNATGQVFEIGLDGTTRVIAGNGQRGHDDGDPANASFQMPNGIDISADGRRLYLNESESLQGNGLTGNYPLTPNRLRVVVLADGVDINPGMSGAWFSPATAGQGFLVDVAPSSSTFFAAWFTYRGNEPLAAPANDHRWYTLQGTYNGAMAQVEIFETTGGLFDAPSETTTEAVGRGTVSFNACDEAVLTYVFDTPPRSGRMTLSPLLSARLCAELARNRIKRLRIPEGRVSRRTPTPYLL